MGKQIDILGIAGSLRKTSYNKGLLKAAVELVPANCSLEIFDLAAIPLYNQEQESPLPDVIAAFKARIRKADAIVFATPEYNYSIPGVLKNAIDWASRPYGENAWNNKPVAVMGASVGLYGTSRAQYHLRQVFVTLNMRPLNQPEVMIGLAQNLFDAVGNLTDEKTRQKIAALLLALKESIL